MKAGVPKVLDQLQQAGGGLTDGSLLARFVATRDEASFVALLRRHGPMVLGVCRRVLGNLHDAEDAFQATFLILARKAASVAKRESVGCFLYGVAYRTALEAAKANARRRARERRVRDMPQPEVVPAKGPDWRPLLDRELDRLSEKYRAAVVLCDLEGHTLKEVANHLGVPVGTVSSRLTRARTLLAKRLAGRGLTLSATALAALVAAEAAAAQVPAALAASTARVATLVAAGHSAAAMTPAVVLMKGVMKAMLLKKLRLAVGAVMVAAALGAVGFACRPGNEARAQQTSRQEKADGKPLSELEALRKENELLKYNLQIVLEKSAAQEKELRAARAQAAAPRLNDNTFQRQSYGPAIDFGYRNSILFPPNTIYPDLASAIVDSDPNAVADPAKEVESAVKALREARDKEGQRRAVDALEKAAHKLRLQLNPGTEQKSDK